MGNIPAKPVMRQCLQWLNVHYQDLFCDYGCSLKTGQALALFLEATLASRKSNEAIAENLKAKKWLQKWLELPSVSGSTLYRKLETLPLDLLKEVFEKLYQAIAFHYAGKAGIDHLGRLSIIDSTEIRLPPCYGQWAYTSSTKNAVKMHTMLLAADANSVCPEKVVLSTAAVSDQAVVMDLMVEPTNTYVFDRGYLNYALFHKWVLKNRNFVVRIKANSRCKVLLNREVPPSSSIERDADVELVDPQTQEAFRLRLVEYTCADHKKKTIRIRVLTNRWDISAQEVSDIYRYRWKIELFFKWMKQHVQLKKLYNTKPAAVWNQIYLSLIAYALVELIRLSAKPEETCLFVLDRLLIYADLAEADWKVALQIVKTRTSLGRRKKKRKGRPRKSRPTRKAVQLIVE